MIWKGKNTYLHGWKTHLRRHAPIYPTFLFQITVNATLVLGILDHFDSIQSETQRKWWNLLSASEEFGEDFIESMKIPTLAAAWGIKIRG